MRPISLKKLFTVLISGDYSFSGFFDDDGKTYYSISCWDAKRSETYGDFIAYLLDLDIRAH